jgi:hypothetical protein
MGAEGTNAADDKGGFIIDTDVSDSPTELLSTAEGG